MSVNRESCESRKCGSGCDHLHRGSVHDLHENDHDLGMCVCMCVWVSMYIHSHVCANCKYMENHVHSTLAKRQKEHTSRIHRKNIH